MPKKKIDVQEVTIEEQYVIKDEVDTSKFKENISKIDSDEKLLVIEQMTDSLYDYYDNQAKANEGMYNTEFQEEEYKIAKRKCNVYLKFRQIIFDEIENRINALNS